MVKLVEPPEKRDFVVEGPVANTLLMNRKVIVASNGRVSVVIAHMGPRRHDLWESKAGFEGEFDGLPAGVRVVDLYTRESVCVVDGKRTCILTTHVRSDREATDDEITSGVSLPWSRSKWMSMA